MQKFAGRHNYIYFLLIFILRYLCRISKNAANFSDYVENVIEKTFNEEQLKPSRVYYEDLIANIIIYKKYMHE